MGTNQNTIYQQLVSTVFQRDKYKDKCERYEAVIRDWYNHRDSWWVTKQLEDIAHELGESED